jgi:hypothetical protein
VAEDRHDHRQSEERLRAAKVEASFEEIAERIYALASGAKLDSQGSLLLWCNSEVRLPDARRAIARHRGADIDESAWSAPHDSAPNLCYAPRFISSTML